MNSAFYEFIKLEVVTLTNKSFPQNETCPKNLNKVNEKWFFSHYPSTWRSMWMSPFFSVQSLCLHRSEVPSTSFILVPNTEFPESADHDVFTGLQSFLYAFKKGLNQGPGPGFGDIEFVGDWIFKVFFWEGHGSGLPCMFKGPKNVLRKLRLFFICVKNINGLFCRAFWEVTLPVAKLFKDVPRTMSRMSIFHEPDS